MEFQGLCPRGKRLSLGPERPAVVVKYKKAKGATSKSIGEAWLPTSRPIFNDERHRTGGPSERPRPLRITRQVSFPERSFLRTRDNRFLAKRTTIDVRPEDGICHSSGNSRWMYPPSSCVLISRTSHSPSPILFKFETLISFLNSTAKISNHL